MRLRTWGFCVAGIAILLMLVAGCGCRVTVKNDDGGQQAVIRVGQAGTTLKRGADGTLTKSFYRQNRDGSYAETTVVKKSSGALETSYRKGRSAAPDAGRSAR